MKLKCKLNNWVIELNWINWAQIKLKYYLKYLKLKCLFIGS